MSIELLPCPFCGERLSINNANLAAHPRFSKCFFAASVIVMDSPVQVAAWNTRRQADAAVPEIPAELFDGFAVYKALSKKAMQRTGAENVSDVLDALVALMKRANNPAPL